MQCTSYYIVYLHYNIKASCRDEKSKSFILKVYSGARPATLPDGCQKIFADQQPHKVNDRSHQARVGAFGLFDTTNTPYFTHL